MSSTDLYSGLESGASGFDRVGGLEIAVSESALANLERRARMAADPRHRSAGCSSPTRRATLAPPFVDRSSCLAGLLFPGDGVARGSVAHRRAPGRAGRGGVKVRYNTACTSIIRRGQRVTGVETSAGDRIAADDVVIAAGIWGSEVAALAGIQVCFTPVAHPYVYGPARAPSPARLPFAKWRGETVYARDHGDRLGIGTHTNDGPAVDVRSLTEAELPWPADGFEPAIEEAMQMLPQEYRFPVERRLNGVFSMTADSLPLLGSASSVDGLWIAESLWLTHAGGAASALVEMMTGHPTTVTAWRH